MRTWLVALLLILSAFLPVSTAHTTADDGAFVAGHPGTFAFCGEDGTSSDWYDIGGFGDGDHFLTLEMDQTLDVDAFFYDSSCEKISNASCVSLENPAVCPVPTDAASMRVNAFAGHGSYEFVIDHLPDLSTTRSHDYALGTEFFFMSPANAEPAVGGAGFLVDPRTSEVTIDLDDAVTTDTEGEWVFFNETWAPVGEGDFCGSTTVDIPDEATQLGVFVGSTDRVEANLSAGPSVHEPECSEPSTGTVGTITTSWS